MEHDPLRQKPSGGSLVVSGGKSLGEGFEGVSHEVIFLFDEELFYFDDAGLALGGSGSLSRWRRWRWRSIACCYQSAGGVAIVQRIVLRLENLSP